MAAAYCAAAACAGEHTAPEDQGFLSGGVVSGERAATEVQHQVCAPDQHRADATTVTAITEPADGR